MSEKRLPPHITEDDVRLITEIITPTIAAAVRADQIEKDAGIAEAHHESVGGLIASSTLDLPYIISRTIRAQTEGEN